MQTAILQAFPGLDLQVIIVWIDMLETDNAQAAQNAAALFNDPRLIQFHDPRKLVGKAIAESLGGQGKIAWDTYLFYAPGLEWNVEPPKPSKWMHQLNPSTWAAPDLYRTGSDLVEELRESVAQQCYNRPCLNPNG